MTFREKLEKEKPGVDIAKAIVDNCPSDYGYERYTPLCPMGREQDCADCWNREMPEPNLVVGDSKVEHPDTDIPEKKEEKKMIYAHVGPDFTGGYVEESSTIVHRCEPGKPDLELKVERKTMLGTDDMHITSETIPASKIINLSPDEKTRLFEIIDEAMSKSVDETTKPKVFCISGKAQHGKDTTAGYLKEYLEEKGKRVLIAHYGDLVKYICTTFFDWDGQKDEHGRSLLQEVGTDTIRAKTPDFWVRFIKDVLDHFPDKWDYVIIPDCRFPNEVEYLKEHGYSVKHVRVIRSNFISPLTIEQQKHASEVALDDVIPDVILFNTFGLEELKYAVRNRGLDE